MSSKSPFLRHPWLNHPFIPKLLVCFFEGYSFASFRKDLIAGITVGIIALPLAMAFAIAAGVEPSRGLYTAVVAGFIISLLGGSRIQIGGPTGAFVVIIYSTLERHGYNGLVVATLMAGVLLLLMGLFRVGRLIRFVPYPLIIGFTTGLALLIFTAQMKDFFGLTLDSVPSDFIGKWVAYASQLSTLKIQAFVVGAFSLAVILFLRRFVPKAPWGITAIILSTLLVSFLGLDVETIGKRYGELPHSLPGISFPEITWDLSWFQALLPDAFAIAMLAGLESLLSALMGDNMIGGRHKSDCELMAQAAGNIGSVLFGGIPATGAIARTAANIKVGARTPVAGLVHALTLLAIMGLCAPIVGKIPLAALSSVLIIVAWNMAELHRFVHLFLKAPRGDIAVMLTAFALTVIVDLSFAIQMSMLLALFLFMKRISEKQGRIDPLKNDGWKHHDSVEVYDIQGPLFFGVADRVRDLASPSNAKPTKYFVLRMQGVPILDASGLNALSELIDRCQKSGIKLLLAEIHADTHQVIEKFGLLDRIGKENLFEQVRAAIETAHGEIQAKS
jgi:sulfate permease, SulP family